MPRTAILKGFTVSVVYNDWSHGTTRFKSQNAAKAYINGLDMTEIHTLVFQPVWSEPGESISIEVHQQGEDERRAEMDQVDDFERQGIPDDGLTEQEALRVNIALANDRERKRLQDNQKRLKDK